MEQNRYDRKAWQIAKRTDLVEVAKQMGFTIVQMGNVYSVKEMDSLRIYNHATWNRFSGKTEHGISGGSQIDFLMAFGGMKREEAVDWLLDFANDQEKAPVPHTDPAVSQSSVKKKLAEDTETSFLLPQRAKDCRRLYGYLIKKRGLSKETVDLFIKKQLIYESFPKHNIIFLGKDKAGAVRFASQRGTSDYGDTVFKGDVEGNNKNFGFHLPTPESREIAIFEGGIDLMSYFELRKDREPQEHLLALGMVYDAPLHQYLQDYPQINTIFLCLDNDGAGKNGCERIRQKYERSGYSVINHQPPEEYKDYNDFLSAVRKEDTLLREWRLSFCEVKKQQDIKAEGIPLPSNSQNDRRR